MPPKEPQSKDPNDRDLWTKPPNVDRSGQIGPAVARKVIDAIRDARAEDDKQRDPAVVRLVADGWLAFGPISPQDFEMWGRVATWSTPAIPELSEQGFAQLLLEFARLDQVDDELVLAFAGHHGQLGLCRHGRPRLHRPGGCGPIFVGGYVMERVADWRFWAHKARAVVQLATLAGRSPAPAWTLQAIGIRPRSTLSKPLDLGEEARRIKPEPRDRAYRRWDESTRQVRETGAKLSGSVAVALEKAVNTWLDEAGVGIRVASGRPYTRRPNLLGTIGWALLQTVTNGLVVICSLCHEPYRPGRTTSDRRPRLRGDRAEAPYCPTCRGTPAAKRDIAARFRASPAGKAALERRRSSKEDARTR